MNHCANCHNCFCTSINLENRKLICQSAHRVQYKKRNEQIILLDHHYILVIEDGYILTSRGYMTDKEQGTDILGPGSLIGVVQINHDGYEAMMNMLPLTPVVGCLIRLDLLEKLANEQTDCATAIMRELTGRFGRVVSKLAIHSYGTSAERLDYSERRVAELGLENQVTQEDLACLSGLSRATVTRLLNADTDSNIPND